MLTNKTTIEVQIPTNGSVLDGYSENVLAKK